MSQHEFDAIALNVDRDVSEHIDQVVGEYAEQFPEMPLETIMVSVLAGAMGGAARSLLTATGNGLVRDGERTLRALLEQTADVWRQLRAHPAAPTTMQ